MQQSNVEINKETTMVLHCSFCCTKGPQNAITLYELNRSIITATGEAQGMVEYHKGSGQ